MVNEGRDPFNQTFRKFRSKTQWIGSVQPEKFRKTGSPFEVVLFSPSDRLEFWLNGSRSKSLKSVPKGEEIGARDVLLNPEDKKRFDDEF